MIVFGNPYVQKHKDTSIRLRLMLSCGVGITACMTSCQEVAVASNMPWPSVLLRFILRAGAWSNCERWGTRIALSSWCTHTTFCWRLMNVLLLMFLCMFVSLFCLCSFLHHTTCFWAAACIAFCFLFVFARRFDLHQHLQAAQVGQWDASDL